MIKKNNLTIELPNFEGPLDLLLHLIQSQKIDIYDIPIAQITSQYLSYLQQMKKLSLQIAGEYFVMSSTLLRIKSQYLLPKNDFIDNDENIEDPRDELVQQLVQYSVFKKISVYFKERNKKMPTVMAKEASISNNKLQPLEAGQVTAKELVNTFTIFFRKSKFKKKDIAALKIKETPINEMIDYLYNRVNKEKNISFFSCITKAKNLDDVVGLFLAMLELCRKQQITIRQSRILGDIELER